MVLFAVGFIAITVMLIVVQPGANRRTADMSAPDPVTRAEPALAPLPQESAPVAMAVPDFTPALPSAEPAQAAAPVPTAGLDDQAMRQMTWETLSSLNHATGRQTAPGQPGSLLHTIVRRSLDAPVGAAPPQAGKMADMYVVQAGDSLVSIAEKIYGDVNMTGPLFAANQSILTRPDDLRPGQTLMLPSK